MEVAIPAGALLGEGPRWDAETRTLLWVDLEAGELHLFDPATGADRSHSLDGRVGVGVPAEGGEVLVALADRLAYVDPTSGASRELVRLPHGRELRLNDGACDPAGRFWVGSMALDYARGAGTLYRYAGGALEPQVAGVTVSNGIGWSPDGRVMYYVDSLSYRVDVFDFDVAAGTASDRRPFVTLPRSAGVPDGLAVDDDGFVWLALWGGGRVTRYRPDGTLDGELALPVDYVTACAFGGDDGRALFITTASHGLAEEAKARQPHAGHVFAATVGVGGPPARPFAG